MISPTRISLISTCNDVFVLNTYSYSHAPSITHWLSVPQSMFTVMTLALSPNGPLVRVVYITTVSYPPGSAISISCYIAVLSCWFSTGYSLLMIADTVQGIQRMFREWNIAKYGMSTTISSFPMAYHKKIYFKESTSWSQLWTYA